MREIAGNKIASAACSYSRVFELWCVPKIVSGVGSYRRSRAQLAPTEDRERGLLLQQRFELWCAPKIASAARFYGRRFDV